MRGPRPATAQRPAAHSPRWLGGPEAHHGPPCRRRLWAAGPPGRLATGLLSAKPLKCCGFAFKFLEKQLGHDQYYLTTSEALPENSLFSSMPCSKNTGNERPKLTELASSSKVHFCHCCHGNGGGCSLNMLCYSCWHTTIY